MTKAVRPGRLTVHLDSCGFESERRDQRRWTDLEGGESIICRSADHVVSVFEDGVDGRLLVNVFLARGHQRHPGTQRPSPRLGHSQSGASGSILPILLVGLGPLPFRSFVASRWFAWRGCLPGVLFLCRGIDVGSALLQCLVHLMAASYKSGITAAAVMASHEKSTIGPTGDESGGWWVSSNPIDVVCFSLPYLGGERLGLLGRVARGMAIGKELGDGVRGWALTACVASAPLSLRLFVLLLLGGLGSAGYLHLELAHIGTADKKPGEVGLQYKSLMQPREYVSHGLECRKRDTGNFLDGWVEGPPLQGYASSGSFLRGGRASAEGVLESIERLLVLVTKSADHVLLLGDHEPFEIGLLGEGQEERRPRFEFFLTNCSSTAGSDQDSIVGMRKLELGISSVKLHESRRNCGEVLWSSCAFESGLRVGESRSGSFWLMEAFGESKVEVACGSFETKEVRGESEDRVSRGRLIFLCSEELRMFDENHGVGNTRESLWLGGNRKNSNAAVSEEERDCGEVSFVVRRRLGSDVEAGAAFGSDG
ncbi:hypothetical protein FNV43_RR17385 [Rhamnella rubrinervis]|uniref:Uncharacterized protein n=1 Tax=Rhamnella rubrinervis TaxID=2594499 RepID=A0A8K0E468_9ROSA|nr:hypothetical protein FNV43_RR17385 [Rhamnella rubrinervis]